MEGQNGEKSGKGATATKEKEILRFWQENRIFEKTLKKTKDGAPFVFYDGPPFATGLPHYGHLLAGTIKDAIPRYQTMRGRFVRRQWGWDCHGLPVENLIESELGLEHKKDIEKYGIGNFNKAARDSVLRYDHEWREQVPRMGRFVDMEKSYKTMDAFYTESIWWAFKELHNKGLIYEGYKAMHICPRCETALASAEVAQGYKDVTDISVTVKFELEDEPKTYILAWTTTPWTLPGNVALAVGKDIEYVKIRPTTNSEQLTTETYIVAKDRLGDVIKDEAYEIVETIKGKNLVGKKYKPLFDYYADGKELTNRENGWKIYAADFVTTDTGTGIVHIAPAFGEDDMRLGKENDLPFVQHIGIDGVFKPEVKDFAGLAVKKKGDTQSADIEIIKYLAHHGTLFAKEKISHSYPHCWRCDTPLLNYATTSWFIAASTLREKLTRENNKMKWVPEAIGQARFGNWLEGARDWAISRSRYWGAPLPVWKCSGCARTEIAGSLADILGIMQRSGNTYIVMRHGFSESNQENIASSDPGNGHHLTEHGREEIKSAAEALKKKHITRIFTSDFVRTKETAALVADNIGFPKGEIVADERLREINTGTFNGKSNTAYHAYFSSIKEKFTKRPPEGENLADLKKRAMAFLFEMEEKYKNETILIVTHEYAAWMLFAGAQYASEDDAARMKEDKDDFLKTAEAVELPFIPFPRNEQYELDLHRPYIDEVKFVCSCGGTMKRIPEVFDCWVESGAMPFAQFHYPFENKDMFKSNFPADFIAEGVDQTRGWFYSLLVLGVGLFGESPYKNVVVNGTVLAEDGQKMSKRLKNYPDPMEVVEKYGADAVRYYLLSSPVVRGEDLSFSEKGVDEVHKKIVLRLGNVVSFYELYKDNQQSTIHDQQQASQNVLDAWILARLGELTGEVTSAMEAYELDKATRPLMDFVDDLSTWYIRRSRDRFKSDDAADKTAALATTRYVLTELAKVLAPFMPFLAEEVYQKLTTNNQQLTTKKSVHLEDWPEPATNSQQQTTYNKILEEMAEVRRIVSLGLEARAKANIKVRQPLRALKVKSGKIKEEKELIALIKDEVNVKEVVFANVADGNIALDTTVTDELKKEGQMRELTRGIQDVRKKAGLSPSDRISLTIATSIEGEGLIGLFEEQIKKTVLAKDISFADTVEGGEEIKIDNILFNVLIKK